MEDILISGFLYKRRGGFGKMMANAWQHRYFIITDSGILCYFDSKPSDNESHSNSTNNNSNSTNNNNSVSNTNNNSGNHMLSINLIDNKPRGKIDLKAVQYELVTDLHIEGAPTSYALQITPLGDERWKLCADTKEEHSLWCNIIEKFVHHNDVPINKTDDPISYTSDDDGKHKKSVLTARGQAVTSGTTTVTSNRMRSNTNSNSNTNNNIPVVRPIKPKQGLKLKKTSSGQDTTEWLMVIIILNISIYGIVTYTNLLIKVLFVIVINIVVAHTLTLRSYRITKANATIDKIKEESLEQFSNALITNTNTTTNGTINSDKGTIINRVSVGKEVNADAPFDSNDKPSPGFTFKEVEVTDQKLAPAHTWCKCDHKLFNVRIGPDYNRFKKKAPSGPPLFEAIAVDVFCTKLRMDHAARRFKLPDTSHINTYNKHVPPLLIIQIQIPSEAPQSFFTSPDDGPGWAIMMYFKITEDTCNQLKNIETASPAVKLFAEYCEKAPNDPTFKGRFKVINSCTNLEQLGMPSAITTYNAKPVLIRRTGSIFQGPSYMEMNIHVHKFATLAKQSIFLVSSRCGLMYMQIGFVVEGRDDSELPETLFACVGINKPQEDQAAFIFEDT